jgi:hypothetical protein
VVSNVRRTRKVHRKIFELKKHKIIEQFRISDNEEFRYLYRIVKLCLYDRKHN